MPCSVAHAAVARACSGVPEVRLTSARPDSSPATGSSTLCRAASSRTHVITSGLAATASATVSARVAPAATSASAFALERFHTVV